MSKTIDGLNVSDSIDQATFVAGSTIVHMQATPGGTEYNFNLPDTAGSVGDLLTSGGGGNNEMTWTSASFGTGTVTSVAATVPAFMTVSGTPITTTGTLAFGLSGTALPVVNGGTGVTTATGTGAGVHQNNAALTTPTINSSTLGGTTTSPGTLNVTNSTASTSTSTGAVIVSGGVGISGNTNIGGTLSSGAITNSGSISSSGVISTTNATASTSTGTGALTVVGGVGIGGNLNVGGTITGTIVPGSINTGGTITTTNATQSTSTTTGAIVASSATGGLGIGGNANIGGIITTTNTTDASFVNTGALQSAGGLGVAKATRIGGLLEINKSNINSADQFGIFPSVVDGRTNMKFYETLAFSSQAWYIGSNITVAPNTFEIFYGGGINSVVQTITGANGDTKIWSTTGSTSPTTGSFTTQGGIGVAKNITSGGTMTVGGTTAPNTAKILVLPTSTNAESSILYSTTTTGANPVWVAGHNAGASGTDTFSIFSTTKGSSPFIINNTGRVAMPIIYNTPNVFNNPATVTLTSASSTNITIYGNTNTIITLPNATTLGQEQIYRINNSSNNQFQLKDFGGNFIKFLNTGADTIVSLFDNTSANGVWETSGYMAKNSSWGNDSMVIAATSQVQITGGVNSTSSTTGILRLTGSGGLGVGGNIHAAGSIGALFLTTNDVDQFTYSTGTFAPTLAGDVTYVTQTGRFIQTGAEVKVAIYVQFNVVTSGTDMSITNLPFTTAIDGVGFGVVGQGGITGVGTVLVARGVGATTDLNFYSPLTETPIVLDNTWPTVTIQGLVTYFI